MSPYEPVIGLEIHAELLTKSKMFCGCRVVDSVEAEPNIAVCPICLGMPGMLPVINRQAVNYAMLVALALNCTIQSDNVFARKNYFYPDLPKGYQVSQYELPLATDGWLEIKLSSTPDDRIDDSSPEQSEGPPQKKVRIRRVHLEEDTGKLTHLDNGRGSLVDYNRSGVPLLEIVSEPDLRSVEEARVYTMQVRQILRYLGVNSGDMEKGVIRFEANVSLRPASSQTLGTRTEIKNLNSFRSLSDAINFELDRQAAVLDRGETVVQDTMGWSESRRETFSQRGKEEAHDYRYFPEPDLPPLSIDQVWISDIKARLPELPNARVERYRADLGLSLYEAKVLAEERPVAEWFDAVVAAGGNPETASNWMINTLFSLMNEHKQTIDQIKLKPEGLVELTSLVDEGVINNNTAKDVLADAFLSGRAPGKIVAARGLAQISDEAELSALVASILQDNPQQVDKYLSGKESLRGWFIGQVMKATHGKANPELLNKILAQHLAQMK